NPLSGNHDNQFAELDGHNLILRCRAPSKYAQGTGLSAFLLNGPILRKNRMENSRFTLFLTLSLPTLTIKPLTGA
ncbi:MAG TPA: hypothetical protein PKI07_10495, partial [Verrucomicrobiota bacterium]|nr:hypothetical protein [Verrucomicrobiota bacterium]